ncbi:hypothetical protein ONZ45_g10735 [Pleurotus djamor]|nr:hypothetical protein ONZ45_g10735 [Pleurotus djamor]
MASYLDSLVGIIASNAKVLNDIYAKDGLQFPSLEDDRALKVDEETQIATRMVIAAATQLLASVRFPLETLMPQAAAGMYNTTAIAFAEEYNVADVLKEAGGEGLHVDEIGRRIGVKGGDVARCLRYLATRHIFREVKPDVFANNRISTALLKAKPVAEIDSDLMSKYDNGTIAAVVGHTSQEAFMGSRCFADFLRDPKGFSSPFNMALGNNLNLFEWYELPENKWRAHRFGAAMKMSQLMWDERRIASVMDWDALPAGSVIADVGGNIGIVTQAIARVAPQHRYVIQDLEGGNHRSRTQLPPDARTQVHSFFDTMTIAADVYIMRSILHDWPEAECRKILSLIHEKAKATSKLILFEMLASHACPEGIIGGDEEPVVPYPLLANLGEAAGGFVTMADMQMWTLFNSKERTLEEFRELGRSTGWKLEMVKKGSLAALVFAKVA